eukprot:TRINITY_DN8368_c0_g1_i1.p1 TRINITY_DN8368_c0_g1~~TRINITY_DN8368_c0_g1_i1.p1  ORF type:complete len:550 (+),score=145.71 TRINITY_DN8368_c0_g1_i1:118-1767(+)
MAPPGTPTVSPASHNPPSARYIASGVAAALILVAAGGVMSSGGGGAPSRPPAEWQAERESLVADRERLAEEAASARAEAERLRRRLSREQAPLAGTPEPTPAPSPSGPQLPPSTPAPPRPRPAAAVRPAPHTAGPAAGGAAALYSHFHMSGAPPVELSGRGWPHNQDWQATVEHSGDSFALRYHSVELPFPIFPDAASRANWISNIVRTLKASFAGQWLFNTSMDAGSDRLILHPRIGEVDSLDDAGRLEQARKKCSVIGTSSSRGSLISLSNGNLLGDGGDMLIDLSGCVEGWYFGHFTNQCMQHYLQARYALGQQAKNLNVVLTRLFGGRDNCWVYQKRQAGVEILQTLGVRRENIFCKPTTARRVAVSCIAPHTPFLYRMGNQLLTQHANRPDCGNRVVYFSRARGIGMATNGGRHILNEGEVLGALAPIIRRLKLSGPDIFAAASKPYRQVAAELADVCIFFGPHGGAMYNVIFARPDSAFLEINPKVNYLGTAWLIAMSAGLGYGYIRPHAISAGKLDFRTDPAAVAAAFDKLASRSCACAARG